MGRTAAQGSILLTGQRLGADAGAVATATAGLARWGLASARGTVGVGSTTGKGRTGTGWTGTGWTGLLPVVGVAFMLNSMDGPG